MTVTDKRELSLRLERYGQAQVLHFWDSLSPAEQASLAGQLEQIDLDQLQRLYRERGAHEDWTALAAKAKPPAAFRLGDPHNRFSIDEARRRGLEALRSGTYGVMLVAGGQGTRLGFEHPKGLFPIGPVSGATLFQILLEKVIAAGRLYGHAIPLYVMTSPATHDETVAALEHHQRFGLPREQVTIFCQGTMPAVDAATGRLLLAERGRLFLSPDGHGGMAAAMARHRLVDDMQALGVRHLYYLQIDNPLAEIGDPVFLGYHLLAESEMSTQVVAKRGPADRVGNFVSIDGQARIIEYSDLPPAAGERRNADGSLELWAGNTAVHLFDVPFLRRAVSEPDGLPFHIALKKVPFVDDRGNLVQPAKENALKFERFIFDLLPQAARPIAVEVDEAAVFAPVKNANGALRDTPDTVQYQMAALHRGWLRAAGANVPDDAMIEISPLFALDAKELANRVRPGQVIAAGTYLR